METRLLLPHSETQARSEIKRFAVSSLELNKSTCDSLHLNEVVQSSIIGISVDSTSFCEKIIH